MRYQTWTLGTLILVLRSTIALAGAGREGASFLDIPAGAGPAALGSAYTALATDSYAALWNPAGLARLDSAQFSAQHLAYLSSIHYEGLSAAIPLGKHRGMGGAVQYLGSGDIARMDANGQPLGPCSIPGRCSRL